MPFLARCQGSTTPHFKETQRPSGKLPWTVTSCHLFTGYRKQAAGLGCSSTKLKKVKTLAPRQLEKRRSHRTGSIGVATPRRASMASAASRHRSSRSRGPVISTAIGNPVPSSRPAGSHAEGNPHRLAATTGPNCSRYNPLRNLTKRSLTADARSRWIQCPAPSRM